MSKQLRLCMEAVQTLNDDDVGVLTDRIETYRARGMDDRASERAAVEDLIAQAEVDGKELTAHLREQHPDAFQLNPAEAIAREFGIEEATVQQALDAGRGPIIREAIDDARMNGEDPGGALRQLLVDSNATADAVTEGTVDTPAPGQRELENAQRVGKPAELPDSALARANLGAAVTPQVPPLGAKAGPTAAAAGDSAAVRQAKQDLMDSLGDLGNLLSKGTRANMMPEEEQRLLPILTRVFDAAFRLGHLTFKQAARFVLDTIRSHLGPDVADQITLDHLQGAYIGMAGRYREQGADRATVVAAVESMDEIADPADNAPEDASDVSSTDPDLERNRQEPGTQASAVDDLVPAEGGRAVAGTGGPGEPAFGPEGRQPNDQSLPAGGAAAAGERGDQQVPAGDQPAWPARLDAGADDDPRGGGLGDDGVQPDPKPADEAAPAADRGLQDASRRQQQRDADRHPVTPGNLASVKATLPYLLPGQQEDVQKAETRFGKPDGYGMLFTNGTGTGKTFTGLGIVKRFARQGKQNTLIVVPSDKIAEDWITSGQALGLDITQLASTKEAGRGIVITTYANLGQNDELAKRAWDLVVSDEAHYLMQEAEGTTTRALSSLRAITLHPDGASQRAYMLHRDLHEKAGAASSEAELARKSDDERDWARVPALEQAASKAWAAYNAKADEVKADVAQRQGAARPRAVFLSFTPFAYDKTIDWAQGYLFDYGEGQTGENHASGSGYGHGYNSGDWREKFFMQHLGYRMRINKLTEPDAKVDRGLLRRQFNTFLKSRGVLSGRMLDVDKDYDRRFVLIDSAIGHQIDAALEWLRDHTVPGRSALGDAINERFDYLSRRYLLEAIKAEEAAPIIRQHLALGRKVVVFHDYKKGGGFHPFHLTLGPGAAADVYVGGKYEKVQLGPIYEEFKARFPELMAYPFGSMRSPIETFQAEFPGVLLFNGNVSPRERRAAVAHFQADDSGPQLILVQSQAGKEGISLHDTTGKHQRVLINLGQPTQPTTAMQQEGRIYRTGQASNAIIRYLNTGTSWERWAFATTIAQRSSAAEDLGSGELARALKDSFIREFEASDAYPPGHDGEGIGGKEADKAANAAISEYDRAKAYYFGTQKKTQRNKAAEGVDYFSTPEPIGLKMVEWLGLRPGEAGLEPSAGHGAIARWFNDGIKRTAIEPSPQLSARLALVFDGEIKTHPFEDLHVVNKYDGIAMNPPFGTAGRTAIDHLAKAATHLRDGGRIVALIPTGPSADAKFDKWFHEEDTKPLKPLVDMDRFGAVFKGDTLHLQGHDLAKNGSAVVIGKSEGRDGYVVGKFSDGSTMVIGHAIIKSVEPTGKRTESFSPAAGLHLVADIKLPAITFERAAAKVMTRIVVLEKPAEFGDAPQQISRDYSDVQNINDLFDRLEHVGLDSRAKPAEATAEAPAAGVDTARGQKEQAKADKAAAQAQGARQAEAQGMTLVEHTTAKGKLLKGVVRKDLTADQAKAIDAYTFRKDGGYFIRAEHIPALLKAHPPADPVLSRASVPQVAREPLTLAAVAEEVENRIGGFAHQPPIRIRESAVGTVAGATEADRVSGAVYGGAIYLFRDQLGSRADVQRTLFHELLHYGLRRFLTKDEYVAQMQRLHARDAVIKAESDRWAASPDGRRAAAIGGEAYATARGVDEALSMLAEPNAGAYLKDGPLDRAYRSVLTWLAEVAEAMGFKEHAARLRGVKNQEARALVRDIFGKLRTDAAPAETAGDYADPAFSGGPPTSGGVPVKTATAFAAALAADGLHIKVAATVDDMPSDRRAALLARDPSGQARGAYFPSSGEVWLIASNLSGPDEMVFVTLHEAFHRGLHVTFGEQGAQLLRQLYAANKRVRELANEQMRRYGIGKEEAVNEALADLAGAGEAEALQGWQKLVRMVREWVAKIAKAAGIDLPWTDARVRDLVVSLTRAGLKGEPSVNLAPAPAGALASRGNSAFARWFGASKIVDAQGNPRVMYHGTGQDIDSFIPKQAGAIFVTDEPIFAQAYADNSAKWMAARKLDGAPNIVPVYVKAENPFDYENPAHVDAVVARFRPDAKRTGWESTGSGPVTREALASGDWNIVEHAEVQDAIKAAGFDSFYVKEGSFKNLGVYHPTQLKSAVGNSGAYDPEDHSLVLSRGGKPKHTTEELAALAKAGQSPSRTMKQSVMAGWGGMVELLRDRGLLAQHARQNALDQFYGIQRAQQRDVANLPTEQDGYITARLANGGTSSVMRGLLLHGQARWAANGQHLEKIPGTRGLLDILKPLGDDLPDFFGWMVGNRAARLLAEGREKNLKADEIKTLQGLAKTPEQLTLFKATAKEYAAFKRSVLDVAEAAGLIDADGRKAWDHADYIPFYRQVDDRAMFSATGRKGLAGQSSGIRTLRGGEAALNDPLENLLMNFSRLIDASLKNNAIDKTVSVLEAAGSPALKKVGYDMKPAIVPRSEIERELERTGVPEDLMDLMPPEAFDGMAKLWAIQPPQDPDVIRIMRGGKPVFYRVADPLLLKAATSFVPFDFPGLGLARMFKRVLTGAVTATPEFMLRNFVRDSGAVHGITREGVNPVSSLTGIVRAFKEDGAAEAMLFAGASFQGGNIGGHDPTTTARAIRRALRQKGLDASAIDSFMGTIVDTGARSWELYRALGEAVENANREAVFEATMKARLKAGASQTEATTAAAFEAKDLMDFSLRGSHPIYQLAADVLPFFNARVQGMYRMGRSDPKRLAIYGAIMATLSVALAMANAGLPWYEELPDWDKDGYWHMRIGGGHFRIPKPFELGVAFATVPERIARYLAGADSAKKFGGRLWANIRDQLAFDPVPQILRPAANVWANKDTFRDAPIESASDEGKLPHMRYSGNTSATARSITRGLAPVTDELGLSPKKLEYLVGGYLGTAGTYALGLSDMAVRAIEGYPDRPATRLDDLPIVRAFVREDPARSTVYESDLYKVREKVDQVYRSITDAARKGDVATARQLLKDYPKELAARGVVDGATKGLAGFRKQQDMIIADPKMTPEQKRLAIDKLQEQKNELARRAVKSPAVQALQ